MYVLMSKLEKKKDVRLVLCDSTLHDRVSPSYTWYLGWVHPVITTSNEGTPMASIHWAFVQENSPVSRKAAYLFLHCAGREARQITFMWGEISFILYHWNSWMILSAFSLHYFRLVSFVQAEKLHICHHNTVVNWTPCENTDCLLASFQHGSTG